MHLQYDGFALFLGPRPRASVFWVERVLLRIHLRDIRGRLLLALVARIP
jgi:hypothetical protein